MTTQADQTDLPAMLRYWRQARRMSQLDLALAGGLSQKHLSFVESGRAKPSRDMIATLAEALDLPLREHNRLLLAAGFAPRFEERRLDELSFQPALEAVRKLLAAHEPNPAVAVDRHWNLVFGNRAVAPWLAEIKDASLLVQPVNVLRLALHPGGLAPLILNFGEWRSHLLHRLRQQVEASGDPGLADLERELVALPVVSSAGIRRIAPNAMPELAVPMRVRIAGRTLSFMSAITVFGTPLDVTLSELAIETFLPADAETGAALLAMTPPIAAG
jgi:transcriptional regulator with XRE-family HTH domain